jgi:hypothetical protein
MGHLGVVIRHATTGEVIEELGEDGFALLRAMPGHDDVSFPYLRFIDPLDDTVFTSAQMAAVVPELRRLRAAKPSPVLDRVLKMAEACEANLRWRLVFLGD